MKTVLVNSFQNYCYIDNKTLQKTPCCWFVRSDELRRFHKSPTANRQI